LIAYIQIGLLIVAHSPSAAAFCHGPAWDGDNPPAFCHNSGASSGSVLFIATLEFTFNRKTISLSGFAFMNCLP
jgi:hypothetical protein